MTIILVLLSFFSFSSKTLDLPENFQESEIISGLNDPDGMAFSPDGRLFISERISGRLLVAKHDNNSDTWTVNPIPFFTFDIPKNNNGQPERVRSAGLRDIAFDPDFSNNGFIYAFYMKDDVLQNRVVRIKASTSNPDLADPSFGLNGEELLIDLPFNNSQSSGSHNGGAVEFGGDNKLYISTGDGWEGTYAGDPVQSLTTFTGKILRINADGSIPSDNPFFTDTSGSYRAIYALGLRNPYSMSRNDSNGLLYINEARGTRKDRIYLAEAGANYQHEGAGIGTNKNPWATAGDAGGELITGGAWYPNSGGSFPPAYAGVYFTALWGGNGDPKGRINYVQSSSTTQVSQFHDEVGNVDSGGNAIKPVVTRVGPDGSLYFLLTTYETSDGTVQRIRYTSAPTVATPIISPPGGSYTTNISADISVATPGAVIHYTTDFSNPSTASPVYMNPIPISNSTILKAKAFFAGSNPSSTASSVYIIGDTSGNLPPIVDAGQDKTVFVDQVTVLDGSGTTDPDGDDEFLTGELWTQLSGPAVTILDGTEEIASFTPNEEGVYVFELEVSDGIDSGSDQVEITVVPASKLGTGLVSLYQFNSGQGDQIYDTNPLGPPSDLRITDVSDISWGSGFISFVNPSIAMGSGTKVSKFCTSSDAITIEAWVKVANITQDGPARILSLSVDPFNRNFTLAQDGDVFDFRLRTSSTNDNGQPSTQTQSNSVTTMLTQVAFTWSSDGIAKIYKNGSEQNSVALSGTFSSWDQGYDLALGNELSQDRPWLGEIHEVAIYCKALSAQEVMQNFNAFSN